MSARFPPSLSFVVRLQIAYYLLIALFVATLAGPFLPENLVQHAVHITSALLLTVVATTASPMELSDARLSARRCAAAMLVPIAWMLIQLVPLPFASLENPIWSITALALNEPSLLGRVSTNAGSTLTALAWFLTILSLALSTVILTKDRRRAEILLFVLTAVGTLWTAADLLGNLALIPAFGPLDGHSSIGLIAAVGNVAIITMTIERQARRADKSLASVFSRVGVALLGIATASASLIVRGNTQMLAFFSLGVAVLVLIAIARRIEIAPWASTVIATALAGIIGWVVLSITNPSLSVNALGATQSAAANSIAVAQRALAGASWLGGGVGTFEQLARVYGDFGDMPTPAPPSTAALIIIEWGRLALPLLLICALQIFFVVARGAIARGRDSFFSSYAAAIVAMSVAEAFSNHSLLDPLTQILLAGTVGLGISQSIGKTSG